MDLERRSFEPCSGRPRKRAAELVAALLAVATALTFDVPARADPAASDPATDCFSEDNARRISGCTALLDSGKELSQGERSLAHALRALAFSLQSRFEDALKDYDVAISLRPDFDVALNNRAWALFKMGRYDEGMIDVERALKIAPWSAHAFDTRAHLHQVQGRPHQALSDYLLAMRFGGERLVKLYQCGLEAQGMFHGVIDGIESTELRKSLAQCVRDPQCDPLPPDEECRRPTS
ncbi:MAG: tetratricopeptide repeat protein [Hyphomicrobiaceae bacterium]